MNLCRSQIPIQSDYQPRQRRLASQYTWISAFVDAIWRACLKIQLNKRTENIDEENPAALELKRAKIGKVTNLLVLRCVIRAALSAGFTELSCE